MRAMQLVSGSKLKRAQLKLLQARAILEFLDGLLERLLQTRPDMEHPLCSVRDTTAPPGATPSVGGVGEKSFASLAFARDSSARIPRPQAEGWAGCRPTLGVGFKVPRACPWGSTNALVLFTSDAGLCGSYNTNLIQFAESHLRRDSLRQTQVTYIGKKGYRYFTKRGYASSKEYLDLAGRPNLAKAEEIARSLMDRFLSGTIGSIQLLYPSFSSATTYRPTILQWLPIRFDSANAQTRKPANPPTDEYIFEPSPERVFEDLLPRWALAKFSLVMLEAFTSEHSARMIAMKNATDNAEEILKSLTMQRNKIRQASITKELSEIVGTVEALK